MKNLALPLALAVGIFGHLESAGAANAQNLFIGPLGGDVTVGSNWSLGLVPTVANDALFTAAGGTPNFGTGPTPGPNLTVGSLNVTAPGTVTLRNDTSGSDPVSVTFGGAGNQGNSVSGTAADLLFVAAGTTFYLNSTVTATRDRVNTVLGQSGNFNVAGTATISSSISDGGGSFGITKTGAGTLNFYEANTFTGGIALNEGTLGVLQNGALGANTVTFNGGTLNYILLTDPSANFSNAANQDYRITTDQSPVFFTALTSSGGAFTKLGLGNITFTTANTYSGATTIGGGTITLSRANGSIASTTINLAGGSLTLSNNGAGFNKSDRIATTATINLNGGQFNFNGSDQAGTSATQTVGSFVAGPAGGSVVSAIRVSYFNTVGGVPILTAGGITRAAGDLVPVISGLGLGRNDSATTLVSRFFTTTAPALIGTTAPQGSGINAAAKDTKIVPGAVGAATVTSGGAGTSNIVANTFLTYTATGGYRPLNPTDEFTSNSVVTGRNTRITAATTMAASTTINSLVLAGGTLTLGAGTTLTNTSGMVLVNFTYTLTGGTLDLGSAEGIIYVTNANTLTIASAVSAGNGLTKAGTGAVTISGAVTLGGGRLNAGPGSFTLGGSLTVAGGTFDLNGTGIGANSLAPSANVTLTSGTINLTLGASTTPGVTYDAILANAATPGIFTITGGTLALDITGSGFAYSNAYAVFSGFTGANSVSGLSFTGYDTAHYQATLSNGGLLSFTSVPEPSVYAAAMSALVAAIIARRRRKPL